jgi:hypothetical protein
MPEIMKEKVTQALQAGRAFRFTNSSGVSGWAVEIELPSALTPGTTFVMSVAVSENEVLAKRVL